MPTNASDVLRRAAQELRELADDLEAQADLADRTRRHARPPLPEAVMAVLVATQRPMHAREVFDELVARNWAPLHQKDPLRSTKVTLLRLSQRNKLVRPEPGVYALPE